MDQLSWILSLIPDDVLDLIYWAIIAAGITGIFAGWLGKFIPFYGRFAGILKPIGIVVLALGVWLRGGYDTEMAWRAKVAEAEAKVKAAEVTSKKENVKIVTKLVTKTKVIRTHGETVIKYVDKEVVKYDTKFMPGGECEIPKEFTKALNDAAAGAQQ